MAARISEAVFLRTSPHENENLMGKNRKAREELKPMGAKPVIFLTMGNQ